MGGSTTLAIRLFGSGRRHKMFDAIRMPTIHYTEMAETLPDSPVYREARTFRRELPRLLAEGQEGKWALIKEHNIVALFTSFEEGYQDGRRRFLFEPFLVQPVREQQPLVRMKGQR
jgi:hypothetical protein